MDSLKIVVVGASAVGKSSIVQRLVEGTFSEDSNSTCGADFYPYTCPVDGKPGLTAKLQIWDTAGQERFRSISKAYFRNAVGAVLVFDITNSESFEELSSWLNDLHTFACPNAYILLVANKVDLEQHRQVGQEEVKSYAQTHQLEVIETSAASGQNISAAFSRLAMEVLTRVKSGALKPVSPAQGKKLQSVKHRQDNENSCC